MSEQFDLTNELVDQIIFGMENQDQEFVLDRRLLRVIPRSSARDEESDYLQLPPWRSVDGYNVMERFVSTLHNPIFRERLRVILASGRGVFRQFKNALKERNDIERLWFTFKDREMRAVVLAWYNDLREQWGLERVELEGDQTDQLVLTDFSVRPATEEEIDLVEEMDRRAFDEVYRDESEAIVDYLFSIHRRPFPAPTAKSSSIWTAVTPAEEFAGFLWAVEPASESEDVSAAPGLLSILVQLYVIPEYRGLGLADVLLTHYCRDSLDRGISRVVLELHGKSLALEEAFGRDGFERQAVRLTLDLPRWYRDNQGL